MKYVAAMKGQGHAGSSTTMHFADWMVEGVVTLSFDHSMICTVDFAL